MKSPRLTQMFILFVGMFCTIFSCAAYGQADDPSLVFKKCEPGFVKNADGKCVPVNKSCPVGQTKNARGVCVPIRLPACPAGTKREGGECVKICVAGTRPNGRGGCEKACAAGTRLNAQGICETICPAGTKRNNQNGCDPLTARDFVHQEINARPQDPWPTGNTHVVLGIPGTPENEKGYLEPGGSFSPGAGSFGISFWLLNAQGEIVATSDTVEQGQKGLFAWTHLNESRYPGISVSYQYKYDATWTPLGSGKWSLDFKTTAVGATKMLFVVRSVGPAGGAIKALKWDSGVLTINSRWKINFGQPLKDSDVRIGHEEKSNPDWKKAILTGKDKEFKDGWGFATIDISSAPVWKIVLTDSAPASVPALSYSTLKANLEIEINNSSFNNSLNAQVAQLMMGLSRKDAAPGDPFSYDKKRTREAAYTIVALARAGQIELAKELLADLAEKTVSANTDTDTPGLFLWAAEEIAAKLVQREPDNAYSFKLWPQVQQKADLLARMNIATASQQATAFYLQALTYRGLLSAANYADRFRKTEEANRWRKRAEEWRLAWSNDFKAQVSVDSPFLAGLWPSGIAAINRDVFTQALESRWTIWQGANRQLPQNSFELALAHQRLWLEQTDRVWKTLNWYWDNQVMPGLYFWRASNETNLSRNWENVRGWVEPPANTVMPHYWTAAEMLILQLAMLGYVDESAREPVLVIGAGIRSETINLPMNVNGLQTNLGEISWDWNVRDKRLTIFVGDKQTRDRLNKNKDRMVRVGAAFRAVMKGKPEIKLAELAKQ